MYPSVVNNNEETEPETEAARVLIVDDDPDARLMLQRVIERRYDASTASNGYDALRLLETEDFDAVVLDVMMPGMDGLATLEAIRRRTQTLPVLLVSALIDTSNVVTGLKMGANDYITKPLDTNVTLARLDTQIKLKRAQEERDAAIRRAEAAENMHNRLFRVATHDLKNPLANIRMAEYVLRESVAGDPVAAQMMDTVTASLDAMQEVIDDFMNVIVLQSGQIEITVKPVSVERAVYRTLLQYNVNAEKKNITIQADNITGDVMADESRLGQIVANLVSNAVKYSPHNSCVRLHTLQREGRVRLSISDEGPGIPEDERHLLFTEFGKLSPRPTGQEGSTGLGLWIVKTLADLMGGEVGVDCPPDGGSVFWVELPTIDATTDTEPRQVMIRFPQDD